MIFERKIGELQAQDPDILMDAFENPTPQEIELLLNEYGEIKGSLLINGNIVVWGYGDAYTENVEHIAAVKDLNFSKNDVLFNFYYTKKTGNIPPLRSVKGMHVVGPFIWPSRSNESGWGFSNTTNAYRKNVVNDLLKKLPETKWMFFEDALYNTKTNQKKSVYDFDAAGSIIEWAKETGEYK